MNNFDEISCMGPYKGMRGFKWGQKIPKHVHMTRKEKIKYKFKNLYMKIKSWILH